MTTVNAPAATAHGRPFAPVPYGVATAASRLPSLGGRPVAAEPLRPAASLALG